MGEPFRARSAGDDPFLRWFQEADLNRDGRLTADEMRADATRFFQTLDGDHDGEIGPEEITIYESQVAPEVQINTRWKRTQEQFAQDKADKNRWREDREIDGYQLHGLQGAARYGLLNLPEPVVAADADFNRGTTLAEFQAAALQRFQLLDSKRLGYLTSPDLESILPTRPGKNGHVKRLKEDHDARVGLPLPKED
jgi:Ca2+-binding EF-hand superfamily protein